MAPLSGPLPQCGPFPSLSLTSHSPCQLAGTPPVKSKTRPPFIAASFAAISTYSQLIGC
jgi:hypothetical protein